VSARLAARKSRFRRGVAFATGIVAVGGLAVFATGAGAAPTPTVAQVQAKVNALTTQFDKVSEQLDQAGQQLSAAQSRLAQVKVHLNHANTQFQTAQANVAQNAAAAFEDTGATSMAGVLTSGDPQALLQQGSFLLEISGSRSAQTQQLLSDASQLTGVEQEMQRTETGVATLKNQLAAHKSSLSKLIDTEKATLAGLTVPEQQTVATNTIGGNASSISGSTTPQQSPLPTNSAAGKAIAFVYAQLGCPYVYGATGPCHMGFDCSGLMQAAYASAGVQIPRDTFADWSELPHVSMSALEPGDMILYDGEGHVAMYVGNGYIIDSPQTGLDVEKIPESTSWYADNADGAVRP
jgi:cell wall-associated NlpC family hydrolase